MEDIILPLFMCVVMPIAIVWLVMRTKLNETNKMAEIMLKAIEAGIPVDADFFKTQTQTFRKSLKERLLGWLTAACILIALGAGCILVGAIIILINDWTYDTAPTAYSLLTFAGGLVFVIGIALLIVYFIRKRILAKELEAEDKALRASIEQ
ncbi:MAG: hypothetical protein IKI00_09600 [Bacteroidales bacterium]|nr:hypothetical protein [Bacteroidales bacterium]